MFDISTSGNDVVLTLTGSITMENSLALKNQLTALDAAKDLIIACPDLEYIDSSGVACLILAYRARSKEGAKVILRSPSEALTRVLDILKFTNLFEMET